MRAQSDIALIPVESDLDVTTVDAMRLAIDRLIDGGCRRIILNMSGASYVDSAGMGLLLGEIRRMRARGGLISMTNVSSQVLAILRRERVVDFIPVSSASSRGRVNELDPSVQPLWRTVIPIDADDLALARASIGRLLEQLPLSSDELFDTLLATGEAMGNAVDHTSGEGALVSVSGYPDRAVIEVSDCGDGFDPTEQALVATDSCSERGRGIRIMKLLADSVTIAPKPSGTGMLVRIVKLAHASTD